MKKLLLVGLLGSSVLGLSAYGDKIERPIREAAKGVANLNALVMGAKVGAIPFMGTYFLKEANNGRVLIHNENLSVPSDMHLLSSSFVAGCAAGGVIMGPWSWNKLFKACGNLYYLKKSASEFQRGSYTKCIMRRSKLATVLFFVPTYIALAERARIEYRISKSK